MNSELSRMSKGELQSILDEAEEHIAEIRAELERRQEAEQHESIDGLEFSVKRTAVDWTQVKTFFQQVLAELRSTTR